MKIWTAVEYFFYYCSVFVDGQQQRSLKGISGGKAIQQNDSNIKQRSHSSFRHEFDEGNQSLVQHSFPLIVRDETRRLDTTQVKTNHFYMSFSRILELFYRDRIDVGDDHVLILD